MGKTYIYKKKNRFKLGEDNYSETPKKLKTHFNRHNSERKNKEKYKTYNQDDNI